MKLYGLECLEAGVQDQGSNFTRFICISKNLEIYPGADRTSLMAVLPHEPGSLCRVLCPVLRPGPEPEQAGKPPHAGAEL